MRRGEWLVVLLAASSCGRIGFDGLASDGLADALVTTPGVITLAGGSTAGLQDGTGATAQFGNPVNVLVGPDGNIYVADHGNDAIRVMTPDGTVSTVASAHPDLQFPFALMFASDGALIVGTDFSRILQVDVVTGAITVLVVGIGSARGLVELPGRRFVFSNWNTDRIEILEANSTVMPLSGDGTEGFRDGNGTIARFNDPTDLVQRADGALIVADINTNRIRIVQLDGTTTTLAGSAGGGRLDGDLQTARFSGPSALALADDGTLYVADRFNGQIRRITTDGMVTTIAGTGVLGFADAEDPLQASFFSIEGLDLSPDERFLYIADCTGGTPGPYHRVRRLTLP